MSAAAERGTELWRAAPFAARTSPRLPDPRKPMRSAPAAGKAAAQIERVISGLEDIASNAPAAAAVITAVDDPRSDAGQLATAVSADPGLSARLMRLANSAYFGLSGRVSSLRFAVTAVGFGTVRGLAISCATGLTGGADVPDGYWERACAMAVASGAVAGPLGVSSPDAFCAGLLADLGCGLLHRADAQAYAEVTAAAVNDRLTLERELFATTHELVSSRLLAAWSLPAPVVLAVADHHAHPSDRAHALTVAVRVGEEIAHRIEHGSPRVSLMTLSRGRISDDSPVVEQVSAQSEALLAAFAGA